MPTPKTKKRSFELQEVEIKQEVDSPLSIATTPSEFELGTQWLRELQPTPSFIHAPPPDSDDEHISVADNDGNLVGVIVQSKRARLAAEKLKKK